MFLVSVFMSNRRQNPCFWKFDQWPFSRLLHRGELELLGFEGGFVVGFVVGLRVVVDLRVVVGFVASFWGVFVVKVSSDFVGENWEGRIRGDSRYSFELGSILDNRSRSVTEFNLF